MFTVVSALDARTQLGQIMRRAKTGQERFVVDKRGEPQIVILGIDDFIKNIAPETDVLAAVRADAKRKGMDKLSMREIGREIKAYRREKRG
jgi:prevent-host-death family protein